MQITVKSLEELLLDGVNKGPLLTALVDEELDASKVQNALYEWRDSLLVSKASELKDVHDDYKEQILVLNDELAEKDAFISDSKARVSAVKDLIKDEVIEPNSILAAVVAAISDWEKPAVEKAVSELDAQIAALQAQKEALAQG